MPTALRSLMLQMVPALAIVWCSGHFGNGRRGRNRHQGRILTGLNRIGGEWGHNPLPWTTESERPGHRCYCGKFGCIETFLSGAGLSREYFSLSQKERRTPICDCVIGRRSWLIVERNYLDFSSPQVDAYPHLSLAPYLTTRWSFTRSLRPRRLETEKRWTKGEEKR